VFKLIEELCATLIKKPYGKIDVIPRGLLIRVALLFLMKISKMVRV
jgi:hypothetical protein